MSTQHVYAWEPVPYRSVLNTESPKAAAVASSISTILTGVNGLSLVLPTDLLQEFKLFHRLPIEIRHFIYALGSSDSRVVEINGFFHSKSGSSKKPEFRMRSNALVPAIMHACVDSRAAGMKIYEPLVFHKFIGTYINWGVDYVMFKNGTEDLYMTYEGSLPAGTRNFDLVLKVERLAVTHAHVNDFLRIQADPGDHFLNQCKESILVYPSLKEVAIVEVWKSFEEITENLRLRPKQLIPSRLPDAFCPCSPYKLSEEGARVVQNRWHQECSWMRLLPGKFQLLTNKKKREEKHPQPRPPKKLPGVSRFSSQDLQKLCRAQEIDDQGTRKELIARIHAHKATLQHQYGKDLRRWAGTMLGHTDFAGSEELGPEVEAARSKAVTVFLHGKGLA